MTETANSALDQDVLRAAAEWFAYLRDENASSEDRRRWQHWLDAAPEHRRAWQRVENIAGSFERLTTKGDTNAARQALSRFTNDQCRRALKSLAIVLCICLTGWFAWQTGSRPWTINQPDYRTATGETRRLTLTDGTEVWLNTASSVDIDYSPRLRRIVLRDGEILIETAPDNAKNKRPLIVDTDHGRLTALGTRFNVHKQTDATRVTVFAGAVNIAPDKGADAIDLAAGSQGTFDHQRIINTASADPAHQAWTRGILLADNRPLCDFIAELERYHRDGQLVCAPEVAQLKLVGAYPLENTGRILAAIQSSLPVRVWQVSPGVWRVEQR